jgi:hypothetical protein
VKQCSRSKRGDEEVGVAVVVIIPDGDSHAVPADARTGALGDIGEMQIPLAVRAGPKIVSEEPARCSVRVRRPCGSSLPESPALHQEDVEIPVVVVVEQRDARAHHLGHVVVAGRAVDVREREARLGG